MSTKPRSVQAHEKSIVMKKFILLLLLLALVISPTDAVAYNVYYGMLHNHSRYSDGSGYASAAYPYARDNAGLDFFSLADHCSYPYPNGVTPAEYQSMQDIANSHNEDGVYVTFWGFEWTSDTTAWGGPDTLLNKGHITIINSPDHCNATDEATNDMEELVDWMSTRDVVAFYNHPGAYGFFDYFDFTHTDKIVGMELWNRSEDYYSKSGFFSGDGMGYYDEALIRGWHIGAAGSQDHHGTTWGNVNEWRLAILAPELTRASLFAAMQERRFFSSRDKNLVLSFTCDGAQMGSKIIGGSLDVVIDASDGDSEVFSQIELLKNGSVIETWTPGTTNPSVSTTVTGADGDYFYVIVYQSGESGWRAISSPIFIMPDCNGNDIPDEIEIANDPNLDCNLNGIPDECEIAANPNLDCNLDGILDECNIADDPNLDCNGNGIPDECDIANCTHGDLNSNGIPDECDVDFDNDLDVDLVDLSHFLAHWLDFPCNNPNAYCAGCDFYQNGSVNLADYTFFAKYGQQNFVGPVARWQLDEFAGSTAADSIAGNDGTLINGPIWQPVGGQINGALLFDGLNNYVDLGSGFDVFDGSSAFSLSVWIKPTLLPFNGHDGIVGIGASQRAPWLWGKQGTSNPKVQFETVTGGMADGDLQLGEVVQDQWNHIVITWDGSTCNSYIDGTFDNSDPTTGNTLVNSDGENYLGLVSGYGYWDGLIDDVRIYDRVLGLEEIEILANMPNTGG